MLSVTHIALENCPISKVTVDRDERGDSGGAEQHGGGEAETLDEDGPEFFATTCPTGLGLLKCFARYTFFVAQDAKLTTSSGVHTDIIGTRSSPVVAHTSNVASEAVKLGNEENRKSTIIKSFFRFAVSYTSAESANDEEPLVDRATLPSEDSHRLPNGDIHPIQVDLVAKA